MGQWPPATGQWWTVLKGRRPWNRPSEEGDDSDPVLASQRDCDLTATTRGTLEPAWVLHQGDGPQRDPSSLASRTGFCRLSRQLLARGCSSCSTSTSFPLASLTVVCPTFSFPEDALYLSFLLLRPVVVCPGCTSTKSPRTLPFVGSVPFFSAPTVLTVATATERPARRGGCWSALSGGQEAEGR